MMLSRVIPALAMTLATASLLANVSLAQEWTRFRGPNGAGVAASGSGIPSVWEPDDYNWKAELPGIGHSSPVIWGEKIFLLSADPDTAMRYLVCLSTRDGSQLWRRDFKSEEHHLHTQSSYASSTPTVDADLVYFAWSTPAKTTLIALTHDGQTAWERDLGPWVSQHGFGSSPIRYKDLLILHNSQQANQLAAGETPGESRMMAFNARSGETVWETPLTSKNVCYSVPFILETPGAAPQLICCSTAEGIFSINPDNGDMNWKAGELSMRTVASPVQVDDLLFASTGSGGGGNYVIAVKPSSKEGAYEVKSSGQFKANYVPTPVAKDGLLFSWYDKGFVNCLDAKTGEALWSERIGDGFSGSPIRIGDRMFCISQSGDVYVVAASKEFKLLGKNSLGEDSRATPAVAGDRLYLRTYSHLFSIGGGTSGGKSN
ncbi:outer membrane protein assembly factor BamB family protein [Lignipirellula cremea]|uniref:Outer membrane biogenesis protein BamB n=1 Tax=Lignipirellula cremea TaxID=2528010 RepID=A0A518DQX6_9BACT|nr:PQQ-binding-like beta-propeller repeat protein [Lignipirellula cremea]QDU94246.1 outer membrane biogenesis protein BamB [Lignipirellula cremea]